MFPSGATCLKRKVQHSGVAEIRQVVS
jgi:hypothetical protein